MAGWYVIPEYSTLIITLLMKENVSESRSMSGLRTRAIPTQYPPEELGLILSGDPGRLSTKTSLLPALGPSR